MGGWMDGWMDGWQGGWMGVDLLWFGLVWFDLEMMGG
jgi:hypothetical protein